MPNENLFDLTGKVAIVTGTSRGLGEYLARALAQAGADLVLTSRKREHLADFEKNQGARPQNTLARTRRSLPPASSKWPATPKKPSAT